MEAASRCAGRSSDSTSLSNTKTTSQVLGVPAEDPSGHAASRIARRSVGSSERRGFAADSLEQEQSCQ